MTRLVKVYMRAFKPNYLLVKTNVNEKQKLQASG